MTEHIAQPVEDALRAAGEVLRHPWLNAEPRMFREAAFTLLIINLHEGLQGLSGAGLRVSFSDDVDAGDVTDLVSRIRGAVCHLRSGHRTVQAVNSSFNVVRGLNPNAMQFGPTVMGCDYADDAAIWYGANKIYLRRHLERSHSEALNLCRFLCEQRDLTAESPPPPEE